MQISVATIRGLSPNFRIDITEESTLEMGCDLNITVQKYIPFPSGTTAERPADPIYGSFRYNSTESRFEFYDGSSWIVT